MNGGDAELDAGGCGCGGGSHLKCHKNHKVALQYNCAYPLLLLRLLTLLTLTLLLNFLGFASLACCCCCR